jgi:peroxin-6
MLETISLVFLDENLCANLLSFFLCCRFTLHPSVSLASVSQRLPFTYTGADFYALCSDAMLKAVTRQAAAVDAKVRALNADPATKHEVSTAYFFDHYATAADIAVMVREEDFIAAHEELIPSVSAGELAHYERVRAQFEGGNDKKKKQQQDDEKRRGSLAGKGKGKGKAVAVSSDEEKVNGKGKGKAVMGFQDGTASDDEDLY